MSMWKYDVFLSCGTEGVRKGFVDELYNAFKQNGIRAYRDDSEWYSDTGNYHLHEVYEKSMCSIVIFHKKYPYLVDILSNIIVVPIFYKISPEVVRRQTRRFGKALARYEATYESEVYHESEKAFSMAATIFGYAFYETTYGRPSLIDAITKELCKMICEKSSGCRGFESISSLDRRLSVFWDFKNSPIPTNVHPEDIYKNTVAFVRRETNLNWEKVSVSAYADFSTISREERRNLHHCGVKLVDTPCERKDTLFNALLVDLFEWSLDYPPPSSLMLITGNIYFASILHALLRLGHNIILAIPSEVGVSTPLINASNYNWPWPWPNVANGPTSSSQVQIEELPDDNYNWYRFYGVKGEDLVPTSSSQIKEPSMRCKGFESICPLKKRHFIFWDLENCSIPKEVDAKDVFKNILAFVKRETKIDWEEVSISAYADLSLIDRKVRANLQESGVDLIDTPHVKKDAADGEMIVDLLMDSNYFPPQSFIMVITGDVDFAKPLNALAGLRHDIFLAIPSGVGVSRSLINASKYWWYWSDVANGRIEEPSHVDLTGLKDQLVELLKSLGGELSLGSLAREYQKKYDEPLRLSKYKAKKLVNLLKEMSDVISVEVSDKKTSVKLNVLKTGLVR